MTLIPVNARLLLEDWRSLHSHSVPGRMTTLDQAVLDPNVVLRWHMRKPSGQPLENDAKLKLTLIFSVPKAYHAARSPSLYVRWLDPTPGHSSNSTGSDTSAPSGRLVALRSAYRHRVEDNVMGAGESPD
ncbi:unnamed protein product [Pleuronectes platessa]|uniref:Uncharacterized protein n=1 Tax=Pleuronectes platessa TaxID=8262 RepID=A0A9N7UY43_PLEPL|nr:unnamed protein product [Pleuronectes platessa]